VEEIYSSSKREAGDPSTQEQLPRDSVPTPSQWRFALQPRQCYGNAMRFMRCRCWPVPSSHVHRGQSTWFRRILLPGIGHRLARTEVLASGRACDDWTCENKQDRGRGHPSDSRGERLDTIVSNRSYGLAKERYNCESSRVFCFFFKLCYHMYVILKHIFKDKPNYGYILQIWSIWIEDMNQ